MKISVRKYGSKAKVFDAARRMIENVKSYDTKTKIAEMYVTTRTAYGPRTVALMRDLSKRKDLYGPFKVMTVQAYLPDSYATVNGRKVK